MKIKLLILSNDKNYTSRLALSFSKYSPQIELYVFTDESAVYENLRKSSIDVFLSERDFKINQDELSPYCAFAYLVSDSSINEINGVKAVGKYQSIESMYKQIVKLYSENSGSTVVLKKEKGNGVCTKILFTSFSGGVGTSTMAAACSRVAAAKGVRTLYLGLDSITTSDLFFNAEGKESFSDIIYAVKSNSKNIELKLESSLKKDSSGVYFYGDTPVSLDMNEFSFDDKNKLIKSLDSSGLFDVIVFDTNLTTTDNDIKLMSEFEKIVLICDGSEISNYKSAKGIEAIRIFSENNSIEILPYMVTCYNKFSNKTSKSMEAGNLQNIGGIQRLEHAPLKEVVEFISNKAVFSALF